MPLQRRMELIRPNVFQPCKVPACRQKFDRTDVYVRAWRPSLPFYPRHNLKATLYDLKKPFYPTFMYDKPDMTKIMTEEYRRMWHVESLKFLCGVDVREGSRLPRRPYVKYGQFRTYKKNKCGFCYRPRVPLDMCDCHCECPKPCIEKTNFHKNCTREHTYKPFKARPVPCCCLKKRKCIKKIRGAKKDLCSPSISFDYSLSFEKDNTGNDVCKIDYGPEKLHRNIYYDNSLSNAHVQTSNSFSLAGGGSSGDGFYGNICHDNSMNNNVHGGFTGNNNVRNIIYNTENCNGNNCCSMNCYDPNAPTVFNNISNICPMCPGCCTVENRCCPSCPSCRKPVMKSCSSCNKPTNSKTSCCKQGSRNCSSCNSKNSKCTCKIEEELNCYIPCKNSVYTRSNNIEAINRLCCFKNNPITGHCCNNNRIYHENINVKKPLQMPKLCPIPYGTSFKDVCLQNCEGSAKIIS